MRMNRRNIGLIGGTGLLLAAARQWPAQAQSADVRAVTEAVDALNKAMVDVDRPRLEALTAEGLSYGHSAGRIETKQQFVDYLVSRVSAFRSITVSDQTISIVGNDAIVRHILTGETVNPGGQVTPVRIGVLQVWQKQASDWRLLARQAYRI
jgi:hypothetical protein